MILRFQHEQDALEVVLGFGPQVVILEPGELREQVLELARATVAGLEGKPS